MCWKVFLFFFYPKQIMSLDFRGCLLCSGHRMLPSWTVCAFKCLSAPRDSRISRTPLQNKPSTVGPTGTSHTDCTRQQQQQQQQSEIWVLFIFKIPPSTHSCFFFFFNLVDKREFTWLPDSKRRYTWSVLICVNHYTYPQATLSLNAKA